MYSFTQFAANPEVPSINETVLTFNEINFTAILELTPEDDVFYSASVVPFAELVHIENNTWQLIGSYNTSYNVSVVAKLCEVYNTSSIIILEYGKFTNNYIYYYFHYFCEGTCELLTKESLGISDSILMISSTGSRNPLRAGDSVMFCCLSGELIGPNGTTCRGNGDWEPDPSDVMCKQVSPSCKCMCVYVLNNIMDIPGFYLT